MASLYAEMAHELEFEDELAHESVHEGELEHMFEAHEAHHEGHHESFHEGEAEDEMFFNHLSAMADRGGSFQALRRIGMAAARAALRAHRRPAPIIEGEAEAAHEAQHELEWNPARRAYLDAQMEHLGHASAEAASEHEAAEHFLPLIPLAAKFALPLAMKALPHLARAGSGLVRKYAPRIISRVVPQLTRGVGNVARVLYRNPTTRALLHAVPRIARGTMADIAKQYARTGKMSGQTALRLLARRTAGVLQSPTALVQAYRRSRVRDARFHHVAHRALGGTAPVVAPSSSGWRPSPGSRPASHGARRGHRCCCCC